MIWSDELFRILGFEPAEIKPSYDLFKSLVVDEDLAQWETAIKNAISGISPYDIDFRIRLPSGESKIINGKGIIQRNSEGQAIGMSGTNQDLTEKKMLEATLEKERRELEDLYENAPCGFHSLDSNGIYLRINNTELSWIGYTREEVIGKKSIIDFLSPSSQVKFHQNFPHFKKRGYLHEVELELVHKDGSIKHVLAEVTAVKDAEGYYIFSRSVLHDMTLTKKSFAAIEKVAYHDILTGLPNRLLLSDRFVQAISFTDRHGGLLVVGYLDLDDFKLINDQYGHAVGDEVLQEISGKILANIRNTDTLARLGGDEFLILLNVENEKECNEILQRILDEIKIAFTAKNGKRVQINASIGVTLYPQDDATAEVLIRHADQAMYEVKISNGGHFKKYQRKNDMRNKKLNI